MALRIEEYGLIGDLQTAALVGSDGSIDWLCLPSFDSAACFASLLGTEDNGTWRIAPVGDVTSMQRRYRTDSLVLETELTTAAGSVRIIDCMPPRQTHPHVLRIIEGIRGSVEVHMLLRARFDYGKTRPWLHRQNGEVFVGAGPDAIVLRSDTKLAIDRSDVTATFSLAAGERVIFDLGWYPSWEESAKAIDAVEAMASTDAWWQRWSAGSSYRGRWAAEVQRSLITLKALTYAPTGGIVAAATTSLPEFLGGVRNWDYRYCWLRDSALTLDALISTGRIEEATAWRDWLMRAVAGDPEDIQIMYGIRGERRLEEYELEHLTGYEGSTPVRVGNAASGQRQLDVYGELTDAIYKARNAGMPSAPGAPLIAKAIIEWLEQHWQEPDDGIWEVRGGRQHFVHSKVMAWVAVDRAARMADEMGFGQVARQWEQLRDEMHAQICEKGYDPVRNTFTQYYGSTQLDASLLLIPQVGFLPATDPRVVGTIEAVQRELVKDGFVMRYIPDESAADGLPPGEGAFLACSFWLVIDLALIGRQEQAEELFERLLSLHNDLGLFAEEYDQADQRQVGNTPQAFTHLRLIASAIALSESRPEPVNPAG